MTHKINVSGCRTIRLGQCIRVECPTYLDARLLRYATELSRIDDVLQEKRRDLPSFDLPDHRRDIHRRGLGVSRHALKSGEADTIRIRKIAKGIVVRKDTSAIGRNSRDGISDFLIELRQPCEICGVIGFIVCLTAGVDGISPSRMLAA